MKDSVTPSENSVKNDASSAVQADDGPIADVIGSQPGAVSKTLNNTANSNHSNGPSADIAETHHPQAPDDFTIGICIYEALTNPLAHVFLLAWSTLCKLLTCRKVRTCKGGPLFSLVTLKPGHERRCNAAVASVTALVADFDESHTLDAVRALARGWKAILYSTHRHGVPEKENATAPGERYRLVFPLAIPVAAADFQKVWRRFNLWLGGGLDTACKDISRVYYFPTCPPEREHLAIDEVFDGAFLTLDDLPELPPEEDRPHYARSAPTNGNGSAAHDATDDDSDKPLRPGDDYNVRATAEEIVAMMLKHGYTVTRLDNGEFQMRRPGKSEFGISGTVGHVAPNVFYNFSSNAAPFEANRSYSPFQVKAFLEHDGDFAAAARALAAQGYGTSLEDAEADVADDSEEGDDIPGNSEDDAKAAGDAKDARVDGCLPVSKSNDVADSDVDNTNVEIAASGNSVNGAASNDNDDTTGVPDEAQCKSAGKPNANAADKSSIDAGRSAKKPSTNAKRPRPKSQATCLVEIGLSFDLFHTPNGEAWVTLDKQTFKVRSGPFRDLLTRSQYKKTGQTASAQACEEALRVLCAEAREDRPEHEVYVRIAMIDQTIYLDLANKECQVVAITAHGWQIADGAPVKFARPKGLLPLPLPQPGGSLDSLKQFVNVTDEAEFRLMVAFLCGCFYPPITYPVLQIGGGQGSAKTTACRVLKLLVDPNQSPARNLPRNSRDLAIAANNSYVLSFDNVSHLFDWLSDDLCRLATGAGFSTRKLHADDEEMIFESKRPIILNGIGDIAARSDILDRSILLKLPPISEKQRITEEEFWADFEAERASILGALLSAVAAGLANLPNVKLDKLPRMADFARWATACESGLGWAPGAFLASYTQNRNDGHAIVVENSLVAPILAGWIKSLDVPSWEGTSGLLLDMLTRHAAFKDGKMPKDWPGNGSTLSKHLQRIAPDLVIVGVQITALPRKKNGRGWRVEVVNPDNPPVSSSDIPLPSPTPDASATKTLVQGMVVPGVVVPGAAPETMRPNAPVTDNGPAEVFNGHAIPQVTVEGLAAIGLDLHNPYEDFMNL